eukprot:Em0001g1506a
MVISRALSYLSAIILGRIKSATTCLFSYTGLYQCFELTPGANPPVQLLASGSLQISNSDYKWCKYLQTSEDKPEMIAETKYAGEWPKSAVLGDSDIYGRLNLHLLKLKDLAVRQQRCPGQLAFHDSNAAREYQQVMTVNVTFCAPFAKLLGVNFLNPSTSTLDPIFLLLGFVAKQHHLHKTPYFGYSLTLALYHTNDPFEIPVSAPAGSIPFRSVLCRVKPANSHYNFIFWYVQHGAGGTLLSTTFGAPSANRQ